MSCRKQVQAPWHESYRLQRRFCSHLMYKMSLHCRGMCKENLVIFEVCSRFRMGNVTWAIALLEPSRSFENVSGKLQSYLVTNSSLKITHPSFGPGTQPPCYYSFLFFFGKLNCIILPQSTGCHFDFQKNLPICYQIQLKHPSNPFGLDQQLISKDPSSACRSSCRLRVQRGVPSSNAAVAVPNQMMLASSSRCPIRPNKSSRIEWLDKKRASGQFHLATKMASDLHTGYWRKKKEVNSGWFGKSNTARCPVHLSTSSVFAVLPKPWHSSQSLSST